MQERVLSGCEISKKYSGGSRNVVAQREGMGPLRGPRSLGSRVRDIRFDGTLFERQHPPFYFRGITYP